MTSRPEFERRFEREVRRDHRLRRLLAVGFLAIGLSSLATLLVLTIPLGRTSPWLVAVTLYGVATQASSFVSLKTFLYPRFLLRLDDPDPEVSAAAAAVLARHRAAVVRPILRSLLRDADAQSIAAIDAIELASLARAYGVDRHRRFGGVWFAAWCVLSLVVWGTVIATGGGR